MLGIKAKQSQLATLALNVGKFRSHKTINSQELRTSTHPLLLLLSPASILTTLVFCSLLFSPNTTAADITRYLTHHSPPVSDYFILTPKSINPRLPKLSPKEEAKARLAAAVAAVTAEAAAQVDDEDEEALAEELAEEAALEGDDEAGDKEEGLSVANIM